MKRDGRKLDHRTLEEIRRMAPWINQRQLSFHLALSRMTASKILDRRLRVVCTQWPMAAYGKRIPDGSFTAMSLKLATSCPDPNLTLSVSQEPTLLRMKRTYRLQRVFGYLRS